ncbi:MAG: long-chain fatty acid--CoA ligase [Gemmatimonadota bacterium]|nr:long-chain fatty acid--CoA ligase [Gemmatimonadota bacterium]
MTTEAATPPVTGRGGRELGAGTLVDVWFDGLARVPEGRAARVRRADGTWAAVGRREMARRVRAVALGLRSLGLERGDRVAILSHTRLEWALADWGTLLAGGVVVTVYPTLPADQVAWILADSGARVCFASDLDQLAKILERRGDLPDLETVVVFDDGPDRENGPGILPLAELEAHGQAALELAGSWEEHARRVRPSDVATLIYTSGTTGRPKGVQLTHANLHANTYQCFAILPIGPEDRSLSWLPLSHAFERTAGHFLMWAGGVEIAYAEDVDTVARDMTEARPTIMTGVPRMFEKFYDAVVETVESAGAFKKAGFRLARWFGERHALRRLAGRRPGLALRAGYRLADRIVFAKLRERTGGRVRYFVSGAAPLSASIARFFYSGGLTVLEGYGLTETSPVTNVNVPGGIRFGTVGPPVPGTRIRIADDGEILVAGPQVMKGYHGDPEATREALDPAGWLHTGDIGELDADGYLTITDRKKNLIVTAAGKNIAPQPIEERMARSAYVDQVVMLGDKRKFPIAVIVPSFQAFRVAVPGRIVRDQDRARHIDHPSLREVVEGDVLPRVADCARHERPKRVLLVAEPFSVANGLLTPTLKVRRRAVAERLAPRIEELYAKAERETDDG